MVNEIIDKMTVLLGGRVAEQLIIGEATTGAHNDLGKATDLAHKMVREYGMSDKLGPMTFQKREEEIFLGRDIAREKVYSEKTAELIDGEEKALIDQCLARAQKLLKDNVDKLNLLANKLIEREVLEGDEVELVLSGQALPPMIETPVPAKAEEAPVKVEAVKEGTKSEKPKNKQA